MTQEEYYTAPSDTVFNEIKENAIKIWQTYDDTYGYATEKLNIVKSTPNVGDNAWYIVSMFDSTNQSRLMAMVSNTTKELIINARGY